MDSVREALRADECVLWSFTPGGLQAMTSAGPRSTRVDEVSAMLAAAALERDGLVVRPLVADEHQRLGALSFRISGPLGAEDHLVLRVIADMLVPWLAH